MTTTTAPGFYVDPFDPEIYREWDGERWTALTRSDPRDEPIAITAAHVGKATPAPGSRTEPPPRDRSIPSVGNDTRNASFVIAVVWAIAAAVIGAVFIFGTRDLAYGGDAYTGIQNTGAQTVRALGWLIFATGPIGLIIALSRR